MPLETLEATRQEGEEGHRRLEAAAGDRRRYAQQHAELELVLAEPRSRMAHAADDGPRRGVPRLLSGRRRLPPVSTARRRRKKSRKGRWIVGGVLAVFVFAVGIALGQALEDNPGSGHTTTVERTFTLAPDSATVTVTSP